MLKDQNRDIPTVELFTDGACLGNPGPGGWAYILRHAASNKSRKDSGGEPSTTNNRMELTAAIRGLEALTEPSSVQLIGDSQYVLKGINEWMPGWKAKGWRKGKKGNQPIANLDLWQHLDTLLQKHQVKVQWIRGHAGHAENELCDKMAMAAALKFPNAPRPKVEAEPEELFQ